MKLFKAAAGAAIALAMCAGFSLTALAAADTTAQKVSASITETAIKDTDIFYEGYFNKNEDPEYLKYRHALMESAINGTVLGARPVTGQSGNKAMAFYGSEDLEHNSRFDGLKKDYGIDISYYQSYGRTIDWDAVKKSGVKFVIVRIGYRGYGSAGTLVYDPDFHKNIQAAIDHGFEVGAYFYTQAISNAEAKQEAEFCASALKGYKLDLPVYYDIESVDYDVGRLDSAGLTKAQKTALCRSFCDTIESKGYYSGVYANYYWLTNMIDGPSLGLDYHTWVATYGTYTAYQGLYDIWQYSGMGLIDGISNYVDINVRYDVNFAPTNKAMKLNISGNKLSWSKLADADGYIIATKDSKGTVKIIATVTGTSYTITNKADRLTYYVKPFNIYGGKKYYGPSYSNGVVYGGIIKVGKTAGLTAKETAVNTFTVSWNKADNANGYIVYISKNGEYVRYTTTTATSASIGKLNARVENVKVRGYYLDSSGKYTYGAVSDKLTLTDCSPTEVPTVVINKNIISWDKVTGATGYTVYRVADGSTTTQTDQTNLSYTLPNKTAKYFVKPYTLRNGFKHYGGSSNMVSYRKICYPPEDAVKVTVTGNRISWNSVYGAEGYRIYSRDIDGNTKFITATSATQYELEGSSTLVYYVRAYNTYNSKIYAGSESNSVYTALSSPLGLTQRAIDDDRLELEWIGVANAESYDVYIERNGKYSIYTHTNDARAILSIDKGESSNILIIANSRNYLGSFSSEPAYFTVKS